KDYFARLDALLDEDGSIAHAEQLEHIAKGIVIAFRQEIIDIPWLHPGQPLADRLDAFEAFGLPRVKERFWSHARSKAERQIDIDLEAIRPYVKWMQAIDPFDESASAGAARAGGDELQPRRTCLRHQADSRQPRQCRAEPSGARGGPARCRRVARP